MCQLLSALFPASFKMVDALLMCQLDKMPGQWKIANGQLPLLAQMA